MPGIDYPAPTAEKMVGYQSKGQRVQTQHTERPFLGWSQDMVAI